MNEEKSKLRCSGARNLTLGILTVVSGIIVGVLLIVNGGKCLYKGNKIENIEDL